MSYDIQFQRTFEHQPWVDGVDRVSAGGDNGFNIRFQSLESDLDTIGIGVGNINAALNDGQDDLYSGLSSGLGDGVTRLNDSFLNQFFSFHIAREDLTNDFFFLGGTAIVGGRPAQLPLLLAGAGHQYSRQPWTDPAVASADGVPVIPPLTTPTADRRDIAFLDVWESLRRGPEGDPITRLRRHAAVRVVEGSTNLPPPLDGHHYLPLAVLDRKKDNDRITAVEERRPLIDIAPARREIAISLLPLFLDFGIEPGISPWQVSLPLNRFSAFKPDNIHLIYGITPLTLPQGARLTHIRVSGETDIPAETNANLSFQLIRGRIGTPNAGRTFLREFITTSGTFDRIITVSPGGRDDHVIENRGSYYLFEVVGQGTGAFMTVRGITVSYEL